MINIDVLREEDVFAVNPNADITVVAIGKWKHKVVIIDDFYKNPHKIKLLAQCSPYSIDLAVRYDAGIARMHQRYYLGCVLDSLSTVIKSVWSDEIPQFHLDFKVNAYRVGAVPQFESTMIHSDGMKYGFLVYLNEDMDEINGGTSFWRHKETGVEYVPSEWSFRSNCSEEELDNIDSLIEDQFRKVMPTIVDNNFWYASRLFCDRLWKNFDKTDPDMILSQSKDFEMTDMIKMKYNRLVLYPGNLLHAPHIERGMYTDIWRINQVGTI